MTWQQPDCSNTYRISENKTFSLYLIVWYTTGIVTIWLVQGHYPSHLFNQNTVKNIAFDLKANKYFCWCFCLTITFYQLYRCKNIICNYNSSVQMFVLCNSPMRRGLESSYWKYCSDMQNVSTFLFCSFFSFVFIYKVPVRREGHFNTTTTSDSKRVTSNYKGLPDWFFIYI